MIFIGISLCLHVKPTDETPFYVTARLDSTLHQSDHLQSRLRILHSQCVRCIYHRTPGAIVIAPDDIWIPVCAG